MQSSGGDAGRLMPKLPEGRRKDVEPEDLDSYSAIVKHIKANIRYYAGVLRMREEDVRETAEWLRDARDKLMAIESLQGVSAQFLNRAFGNTEMLAVKCGSGHTEANVQRLKLQWYAHEESKKRRLLASTSGGPPQVPEVTLSSIERNESHASLAPAGTSQAPDIAVMLPGGIGKPPVVLEASGTGLPSGYV